MRTELKIYGDGIYFNVDLFDNEPLSLVKEIKDFNEPSSSQSDFTKTIKVPGTANNNQIFSNIFDINRNVVSDSLINFDDDFNTNLKANCILFKDGIPQIRGYLQMTNIILIDGQEVNYELVVIGRNANLFQDLGDLKLTDLDLSSYNHAWSEANIEASWTDPVGSGYVYPLIDRGFAPSEIFYYLDQTYPAVYIKTLVDQIFTEAGYRYDSDFFDSERFKRLIIPFTGSQFKMTVAEVNDRLFYIKYNSDSAYITNPLPPGEVNFPDISKDSTPTGVSGNKFTIPSGYSGHYIFRAELNITLRYTGASPINGDGRFITIIKRDRSGVISTLLSYVQAVSWGSIVTNDTLNINVNTQTALNYQEDGDIFYVEFQFNCFASFISQTDFEIKFRADSAFFNSYDGQYNFGQTINLTNALPADFKQSDLLTSLIKMFNLYFEPDKIDDKKLIIEPRDSFYNDTVIDITDKLDISREYKIVPMGALDFKTLEFHYQVDTDEYNKFITDRYSNEYGWKRVEVSNDFLVEKKTVEINFAPTPLADSSNNDRVISKIRYFNSNGSVKIQTAKPRILYYGGLKNTNLGTYSLSGSRLLPDFRSQFAYAGHLDDVTTQGFDLSYGMPEMIFYGAGTNPTLKNNNLYNLYWKKTIEEITDKNSKILQCYIHFNNVELQNISFRNLYLIDRQYYRLYKIETDLNSDEPARCEFLKLQTKPSFTPSSGVGNGGLGDIGSDVLPDLTYYNYPEFIEVKDQFKMDVIEVSTDTYLEPISQQVFTTRDVFLPLAGSCFDSINNKTMEINIFNTSGTDKDVTSQTGDSWTLATMTGVKFITDGVTWYKS